MYLFQHADSQRERERDNFKRTRTVQTQRVCYMSVCDNREEEEEEESVLCFFVVRKF
jgi:hypothetical protein